MKMQKMLLALLVALLVLTLGGCDMINKLLFPPVTIDQRVKQFESAINTDLSKVYLHLHLEVAIRAQSRDPDYWESLFPVDDQPYTFILDQSSGDTRSGKVTASAGTVADNRNVSLTFKQDASGNWLIYSMTLEGADGF